MQIGHGYKSTHKICAEDNFHGIVDEFPFNHTIAGMNKPKSFGSLLLLKWNSGNRQKASKAKTGKARRTERNGGENRGTWMQFKGRLCLRDCKRWADAHQKQESESNWTQMTLFVSLLANVFICFAGVKSSTISRGCKRNFLSGFQTCKNTEAGPAIK